MVIIAFLLLCSAAAFVGLFPTYDSNTIVSHESVAVPLELSISTYCSKGRLEKYTYSNDFVITKTIRSDIHGLIGYLPSTQTIWVAFRGTESVINIVTDFEVMLEEYTEWGPECENCSVHQGFQYAL